MILVTGMEGTGTAMAMQMVEALGFPVLAGDCPADEHNPWGYYETPATVNGLDSCEHGADVAAKVHLPGLFRSHLQPTERVILCVRNPYAMAYSQRKSGHGSADPAKALADWVRLMTEYPALNLNTRILVFERVMENPLREAFSLATFLGASSKAADRAAERVHIHEAMTLYADILEGQWPPGQ